MTKYFLAAVLLAVGTFPAVAQDVFDQPITEVIDGGPETFLVPKSTLPLFDVALDGFNDHFADSPYFGAFALGKGGSFGMATGANSIEAARLIALEKCRSFETACLIYAELMPAGNAAPGPGQIILNPGAAEYFFNSENYAAYRAFAAGFDGAYAMVWGHPTQAAADAAALFDCQGYILTDPPGLPAMPCQILPGLR